MKEARNWVVGEYAVAKELAKEKGVKVKKWAETRVGQRSQKEIWNQNRL